MGNAIKICFFILSVGFCLGSTSFITALAGDSIAEENLVENSYAKENLETGQSADTETDPAYETIQYRMEWTFIAYAEPDFQSRIIASFPPQDIFIDEWKDGSWALIHTYRGKCWVYLKENRIYIDKIIPIYNGKEDAAGVAHIAPQSVKVIEQSGNWALIETWLGAKWIDLGDKRESVLLDVPLYSQVSLGYPTGCEIVSTAMMINYTTMADVAALAVEMPRSQNPEHGFRGDPTKRSGFTIYPNALLGITEKYLGSSLDMSGCEIEDLKRKLSENIPVVAWVNGLGFSVHAICLTGYDGDGFYYNDPWTGVKNSSITYDEFYKIWNKPIYDRLYGNSNPTRKALSYNKYNP